MKVRNQAIESRIKKNATQLLISRGVNGWSMDRLASQSGMAKNTLYKMVKSKELLIETIICEHIEEVEQRIAALIDHSDKDYHTTMMKLIRVVPEIIDNPYTSAMEEIFIEYPNIETTIKQLRNDVSSQIIAFFDEGIKGGYLRSDVSPESVFELFQALILFYIDSDLNKNDIENKLKVGFKCMVYGLIAP